MARTCGRLCHDALFCQFARTFCGVAGRGVDVYPGQGSQHTTENTTVDALEATVASLEDVPRSCAIATASGMAAVTQTMLALLKRGDRIVSHRSVAFWSDAFFIQELLKFGIQCTMIDMRDLGMLEREVKGCKAVFFEPLSNPSLDTIDVVKVLGTTRYYCTTSLRRIVFSRDARKHSF